MEQNNKSKITPRTENFSDWYNDVISESNLAEHSPVKGCMVIKPYGYSIWERIQQIVDKMLKVTGHQNAYFPIFIPEHYLHLEKDHVEGFSPQLAVVTHAGGKKLKENLVVRPTSETIIYASFAKWIKSWRDLPLLINQWVNVVRWELRTRLFLRTTEFLWQEGHTAHVSHEEAQQETLKMLNIYKDFVENYLAIPVIAGIKSVAEKFSGALATYSIEAMTQDKKALQMGTSHDLGQNFSKVFDVKFLDNNSQLQYVWQTSWGMSTRLIGGMIMVHGDDKGIIIPPKIAPIQVVFIPIIPKKDQKQKLIEVIKCLGDKLKDISYHIDDRDYLSFGEKHYEWEKKGVPIRIEIGPRELETHKLVVVRRDINDKRIITQSNLYSQLVKILETIQKEIFERALLFQKENTYYVDSWEEFKKKIKSQKGFIVAYWCGSVKCESAIKESTKATIRCIPFDSDKNGKGQCVYCKKSATQKVIFGMAY